MPLDEYGLYRPGTSAPGIPTNDDGGSGSPEGVKIGSPFDFYIDTDDNSIWVKATGVGTNTGWVQSSGGGGGTVPTGTGFRRVTSGVEDAAAIAETGTGSVVRATSPTLVTPILGVASASALTVTGPVTTTPVAISALDIDFGGAVLRMKTLSANSTFTFSNPVEGRAIQVKLTNTGTSWTVTWPTVTWLGGGTPVQSANATDIYTFIYWDGVYFGSQVPGSVPGVEQDAYSAGTVYALTATPALLDFGTTDPTITVDTAGTYMIYWGASLKYNAATFAANQTATIKVRRTNNTAADITNATLTLTTRIITTITDDAGTAAGKPVKYVAAAGDILQLWGSLSATPAAGSVDATDAWIVIVRIQ